jgi:arabinofuranosyltransferase
MEMPFHAALLMLSVLSYLAYVQGATPAWLVGCCWVLATLTRPETLTLFGATALFELVRRRIDRAPLLHRDTIVLIGSFGAAYGAYYAWRWLHFGYPFPNTYYAKTGAGLVQIRGGLVYLKDSLRYLFGEGAALVALAALLVRWRGPATRDRAYVAIVVATAWVGIVFVGGDHMDGARFLVATLPLVFALAAAGLSDVGSRWLPGRRASVVIATVLVLLVAHHWARTPPYPAIWRTLRQGPLGTDLPAADASQPQTFPRWTLGFVVMGQTLRQVARPGDSVAVVPVGAIGYYSELRVVDMVGLVDPVIAHQPFDPAYTATWRPGHDKGDGRYVLSRRPTFIQLTDSLTSQPSSEPGRHAMQYKSVVEIWRSPEFHERYVFHPIRVQGGWYYNVYRRVPGS